MSHGIIAALDFGQVSTFALTPEAVGTFHFIRSAPGL